MESLKVKEVGGIEIFVGADGKFRAMVNGKQVTKPSLNAMINFLIKSTSAVKVMIPDFHNWVPSVLFDEITHTLGDKLVGKKEKYHSYRDVYFFDEKAYAEFQALQAEYNQLREKWNSIANHLRRVDTVNLYEKLEGEGDE